MLQKFAEIAGLVFTFAFLLISAKAAEWNSITPIKSTRADVERVLGKPDEYGLYRASNNEKAFINFKSEFNCDDKTDCFCMAKKDTVLWILVTVEEEMKFSALKLDLNKYQKTVSTNSNVTYSNDEEGITYYVWDDEDEVDKILYTPSVKDCPNK